MPVQHSNFRVLVRQSATRQSLFNVSFVTASQASKFNIYTRSSIRMTSEFMVFGHASAQALASWNVGKPVQSGLRTIGSDRWYSMYPG